MRIKQIIQPTLNQYGIRIDKASGTANVYTYYSNFTDRYSTFIMNGTLDKCLAVRQNGLSNLAGSKL